MKLQKAKNIADSSIHDEMVYSGYLTAPKVYNTIDVDYKIVDAAAPVDTAEIKIITQWRLYGIMGYSYIYCVYIYIHE